MEFPTTGEKVKKLRQQLNIIQEDLISENVTRGLISMIETDRRDVTYKTAVKLAEKFSEKAEELNIILNIDEAYLMRSPKEDVEVYCINKLKNEDITKKAIDEIFKLAEEYKLTEVMAKAYCALGKIYQKEKEYEKACSSYKKAKEIYLGINKSEKLGYVYWRLGVVNAQNLKYNIAIEYYQSSQYYCILYKDYDTEKLCLYSLANSYKKVNQMELALETIEKFLLVCNEKEDFRLYVYAHNTRAQYYEAKEEFDTAIDIYKSLLEKIIDNENPVLGYVYNNLGLNYCHKNDFTESVKYFELAEKFRSEVDRENLGATLIEKSIILLKQNFVNEAIETIELGLIHSKEYNNTEYLINGYNLLAKIYDECNDYNNLEKVYLKLIEILKSNGGKGILRKVYDKLILIYLKQNKINQCEKYLLLSINLD